MTKNFLQSLMSLAAMLVTFASYGQQSVNSSGADANGNGGTASYSIGQVVYTTHTGNGGTSSF